MNMVNKKADASVGKNYISFIFKWQTVFWKVPLFEGPVLPPSLPMNRDRLSRKIGMFQKGRSSASSLTAPDEPQYNAIKAPHWY